MRTLAPLDHGWSERVREVECAEIRDRRHLPRLSRRRVLDVLPRSGPCVVDEDARGIVV